MKEKYKELHGILVSQGLRKYIQILDNELTKVLLELMENQNIDFQLVPAHIHKKTRQNKQLVPGKIIYWLYSVALMTYFQ